jgi:anti-sigma factor RsiW
MRCPIETQESVDVLLEYASGKLDATRTEILEQHLRECAACREFSEGQKAVWIALDRFEAPPVSAGFDRALYQRIDREVSWWDLLLRPFRPLLLRQGLPLAAAIGLLIVAGVIERPAAVAPAPVPVSAQLDVVPPEQAEHALQEMEMMREFNLLVHPDASDPKM